jgi:hypothetical protein
MRRIVLATVGVLILAGSSASAHHSTVVNFDNSREISVEGVLTEVRWLNPHARFRVDVMQPDGSVLEWLVEMGAANTMRRAGFPMERFAEGDSVTVIGAAGRRDRAMLLREVVLADGTRLTPTMRPRNAGAQDDEANQR